MPAKVQFIFLLNKTLPWLILLGKKMISFSHFGMLLCVCVEYSAWLFHNFMFHVQSLFLFTHMEVVLLVLWLL